MDRCWQAFLRRFDLEHTFRFAKQTLGWTTPKLRTPEAADRWTWILIVAHTQMGRVAIYLGSLAPCSETVFMPKKGGFVRATSDTTVWTRGGKPAALFFVDRVGISWRRDPADLNQLPTPEPPQP